MADRVVQLKDNQDNNVYPVAGALKQGSVTTSTINDGAVTTSKINDGAVTADKIDFTTIQGGNMPIASSSMHIPYLTADDSMSLWRIGNIVFALANVVITSLTTYDSVSAAEKIPSGFRPATGTSAVAGGSNSTIGIIIEPGGSVAFSNRAAISSSTRFYGHGCWITKDAWPA